MKIFLEHLRNTAEKRKVPIISPQTEICLKEQVHECKPRMIVEIGSAI
jgi:predicted O-methyltransferase YrrM